MCVDPATLALASTVATVGSTTLALAQDAANARGAERVAEQNSETAIRRGIVEQEQFARDERFRQGAEVAAIGASGVSGSYGSPFLVALENAENAEINRVNFGRGVGQSAQNILNQGQAQAQGFTANSFSRIGQGIAAGFNGYQTFDRANQRRLYLGGHSLPGVV